jgi:hypothetical protein
MPPSTATSVPDQLIKLDEGQRSSPDRTAAKPRPSPPSPPPRLDSTLTLTMGQLLYTSTSGSRKQRHVLNFQFNPTEIERTRTVKVNRTPTGNVLEEDRETTRDKPKRKASRKPDTWEMTLALKFDASYYPQQPDPPSGPYAHRISRIEEAIHFFEALVDPQHDDKENENVANANETPPPPYVVFLFGKRQWRCSVKSLRIKEQDYTPDLCPRRFEATLTLDVYETVRQSDMEKPGADA